MTQICTEFSKEYPMFEMTVPTQVIGGGFGGYPTGYPSNNPTGYPSSNPTGYPSGYPSGYPTNQNTGINMGNMNNPNISMQMGNDREAFLAKIKKKCKQQEMGNFLHKNFVE